MVSGEWTVSYESLKTKRMIPKGKVPYVELIYGQETTRGDGLRVCVHAYEWRKFARRNAVGTAKLHHLLVDNFPIRRAVWNSRVGFRGALSEQREVHEQDMKEEWENSGPSSFRRGRTCPQATGRPGIFQMRRERQSSAAGW